MGLRLFFTKYSCLIGTLSSTAILKCRGHAVPREARSRIFSKCALLDYKLKPFFQRYNKFSDHCNRPVKYL